MNIKLKNFQDNTRKTNLITSVDANFSKSKYTTKPSGVYASPPPHKREHGIFNIIKLN